MDKEMVYETIEKAIFLTKFMASVCRDVSMYRVVRACNDYKIGHDDWSERLQCKGPHYTYEFDTTLGCYRFKDKNTMGPWTKWRAIEGS